MSLATIGDAQRRLLAAIAQRLPAERVRELYLFAPIRQGGVETGLAVVAAGDPAPPPADEEPGAAVELPATDVLTDDPDAPGASAAACTPQELEMARAAVLAAEAAVEARLEAEACDPTEAAAGDAPAGGADEPPPALPDELLTDALEAPEDAVADMPAADAERRPPPPERFTVYTARYRLQLKGPDRGKWEVEVVEEADAPLLSVDAVVRGVQRRAGELADVERLSGDDFLQLLAGAP